MEKTEPQASAPERWELRIGAIVYTTDWTLGHVKQVVVDPSSERVIGFIVVADTIPPHKLLVPLEAVQGADDESVQLCWDRKQALKQGAYEERLLRELDQAHRSYAPGEALVWHHDRLLNDEARSATGAHEPELIRIGLEVHAADGRAGKIREVLVSSAGLTATHFVVHRGMFRRHDVLVPVERVRSISAEMVVLDATLGELESLPSYHPDVELQATILDRWWGDPMIEPLCVLTYLHATVRDGVATLEGYVPTVVEKEHLERLARCVDGVLEVDNQVLTDQQLRMDVLVALGRDPLTERAQVEVHSYLGNVTVQGEAPDPETLAAITEVANAVPGVKSVVTEVEAPTARE